jgi:sec-independent protein translocase protein TatA
MGSLSPFHLLVVAAIIFLLFGNRLPAAMRSLGQGVAEFKKGLQGIDEDLKTRANPPGRIASRTGSPPTSEPVHRPGDVVRS